MSTLDRFIPINEATLKFQISESNLRQLIQIGKIRAVEIAGGIVVDEQEVRDHLPKKDRPEYQKYSHLKASTISMHEATRRYHIPTPTISRWAAHGYIAILGHQGRQILICEADIAYCADIYHINRGRGHWLFNPDGTPYKAKG